MFKVKVLVFEIVGFPTPVDVFQNKIEGLFKQCSTLKSFVMMNY